MIKYAAVGVLVRLALWASPLQGYFGSSLQCSTPLTSAARRACSPPSPTPALRARLPARLPGAAAHRTARRRCGLHS
jgi:hypothetical protein